jgi:hypothetical protein
LGTVLRVVVKAPPFPALSFQKSCASLTKSQSREGASLRLTAIFRIASASAALDLALVFRPLYLRPHAACLAWAASHARSNCIGLT